MARELFCKTNLASSQYFSIEKWLIKDFCDLTSLDVFMLICIINGKGELLYEDGSIMLTKGLSVMIPANMGKYQIKGNIEAVVSYIK